MHGRVSEVHVHSEDRSSQEGLLKSHFYHWVLVVGEGRLRYVAGSLLKTKSENFKRLLFNTFVIQCFIETKKDDKSLRVARRFPLKAAEVRNISKNIRISQSLIM